LTSTSPSPSPSSYRSYKFINQHLKHGESSAAGEAEAEEAGGEDETSDQQIEREQERLADINEPDVDYQESMVQMAGLEAEAMAETSKVITQELKGAEKVLRKAQNAAANAAAAFLPHDEQGAEAEQQSSQESEQAVARADEEVRVAEAVVEGLSEGAMQAQDRAARLLERREVQERLAAQAAEEALAREALEEERAERLEEAKARLGSREGRLREQIRELSASVGRHVMLGPTNELNVSRSTGQIKECFQLKRAMYTLINIRRATPWSTAVKEMHDDRIKDLFKERTKERMTATISAEKKQALYKLLAEPPAMTHMRKYINETGRRRYTADLPQEPKGFDVHEQRHFSKWGGKLGSNAEQAKHASRPDADDVRTMKRAKNMDENYAARCVRCRSIGTHIIALAHFLPPHLLTFLLARLQVCSLSGEGRELQ
jgi:hypothetical protein